MKIRIGDLIKYNAGFGRLGVAIVTEQPFANYPVWRVFLEHGERMMLSGDQIIEVINASR